jgi:outer membrane lipoprotein
MVRKGKEGHMRVHSRIGIYVAGLLLVGSLGCASYPISKQYQAMASKDVNFGMVLANPEAYKGAVVIWGGRIVETTNTPQGSEIIVLETPLNGWEEPSSPEYSPGRFVAKSSSFLDPAIYKPGKKITIAGQVTGGEEKPLGTTAYTYPIVDIKQLYLWPAPKIYAYEPVDYWPWWMDTGWVQNPDYWRYPGYNFDRGERHGRGHHEEGRHEEQGRDSGDRR